MWCGVPFGFLLWKAVPKYMGWFGVQRESGPRSTNRGKEGIIFLILVCHRNISRHLPLRLVLRLRLGRLLMLHLMLMEERKPIRMSLRLHDSRRRKRSTRARRYRRRPRRTICTAHRRTSSRSFYLILPMRGEVSHMRLIGRMHMFVLA